MTITLQDALARLRDVAGLYSLPNFMGGLYREGDTDPDDSTPVDAPFYLNTATGATFYLDVNRTAWSQVVDGALLGTDQTVLTATV